MTIDKRALQSLIGRLDNLKDDVVEVGFWDSHYGPENNNLPVALVALWQEKDIGTEAPHIPRRPFMSETFHGKDGQQEQTKQFERVFHDLIYNGGKRKVPLLKGFGEYMRGRMHDIIEDWSNPANAPATIKKKGFNNPLVHTETMMNSIKWRIKK